MKNIVNWIGTLIGVFGLVLTITCLKGANEWVGIIVIALCVAVIYTYGVRGLIQNKR